MKLFAKEGNVTIVGDPDQAIYGWRAAGEIVASQLYHTE